MDVVLESLSRIKQCSGVRRHSSQLKFLEGTRAGQVVAKAKFRLSQGQVIRNRLQLRLPRSAARGGVTTLVLPTVMISWVRHAREVLLVTSWWVGQG